MLLIERGGVEDCLPLIQVDIGFLANQIRVATPDALYLRQCVHDLLLAIDVRIEETEDELEVRLLSRNEGYTIVSTFKTSPCTSSLNVKVHVVCRIYIHMMGVNARSPRSSSFCSVGSMKLE